MKYGYIVERGGREKDEHGNVFAMHCAYLLDTKSGTPGSATVKVNGNIHWVSAQHALEAEVRLYDRLFTDPHRDAGGKNFKELLNPQWKEVITAYLEHGMKGALADEKFQFERHGYFVVDRVDSMAGKPVFTQVETSKDSPRK